MSEHLASSHVYFGIQIDLELRIHIHRINSKIQIQIEIWYTFDAVFYYIVFNFSRSNDCSNWNVNLQAPIEIQFFRFEKFINS